MIPLSDNSGLRLTTAIYFTPDGRSIHEKGITPDIVIALDETAVAPPEENQEQDEVDLQQEGNPSDEQDEGEKTKDEVEEFLKRDAQLQRAVDVLRGILIFEKQSI